MDVTDANPSADPIRAAKIRSRQTTQTSRRTVRRDFPEEKDSITQTHVSRLTDNSVDFKDGLTYLSAHPGLFVLECKWTHPGLLNSGLFVLKYPRAHAGSFLSHVFPSKSVYLTSAGFELGMFEVQKADNYLDLYKYYSSDVLSVTADREHSLLG